jgi:hypothetical protein
MHVRDGDVKESAASHHRPWANSELSHRQAGSIVHPKDTSHGKRWNNPSLSMAFAPPKKRQRRTKDSGEIRNV